MNEHSTPFKNSRTSKIVFILSIIVSGYWWLGQVINVYRFAVVGAIFEILWLPVLAMLFLLPIISLIFLVKEKVNIRSLYVYSTLLGVSTILIMLLGWINPKLFCYENKPCKSTAPKKWRVVSKFSFVIRNHHILVAL